MAESRDPIVPRGAPEGLSGKTVGRFVIGARLGVGGMGEVYRAEDTRLKRAVAVKRLAPKLLADERYHRRFLKEAIQASSLNHPNIAGIYDVLEEASEILLVMELVEGVTLRQHLRESISLDAFYLIAIQCAEALAAAHEKGLVHGDIKPENIMLSSLNQVKVLDFGLAKRAPSKDLSGTTHISDTVGTSLSGTPGYMAPEVLLEKPADGRADIFSLGVVFYEILGNGHPFITGSFAGTINNILQTEPKPLRQVNPQVPEPLSRIVMRMLAKDPKQRYTTAQDLLEDLEAARRGSPLHIAGEEQTYSPQRWRPRAVLGLGLAAVAVALALLGGSMWMRRAGSKSRPSTPPQQTAPVRLPNLISLAVMPATPMAGDPKLTALGNGLVASLTSKLTQLSENRPFLVAPTSEMHDYGVTTLQQAREEFGANLSLQITVERSGDTLRAAYSVIDIKSSRTMATHAITSPASDPFTLEDQLAAGLVTALNLQLLLEEDRVLATHGTRDPSAFAAYLQGLGYLQDSRNLKSIEGAIDLFAQALKLDSNYGLAKAAMGEANWIRYRLTQNNQWMAMAQAECAEAVESGNAGAEAHFCLGTVEDGTSQFQDAVDQFQRALQLEPTRDEAYTGLAQTYLHLSKPAEVERVYQRAISFRPLYGRANYRLAAFYLSQASYTQAAEIFQRVIGLAPDSFRGYAGLGASYLGLGHYAEAIPPLEQSLTIRPTIDAYSNLAAAHFHLRHFDKAAEQYQEATKLDGRNYKLWGNLGDALTYGGRRLDAMNAYNRAISLANGQLQATPSDPELLGALARYYSMLQQRQAALTRMKESLKLAGNDNPDALYTAALVYNQLGETDTALKWLQKALQAGLPKATLHDAPALDNLRKNPKFVEMAGN